MSGTGIRRALLARLLTELTDDERDALARKFLTPDDAADHLVAYLRNTAGGDDRETGEPTGFDALIEAFTIFRRYGNPAYPTHCEHDELWICGVDPDRVSEEDAARLAELGFFRSDEGFKSYRFGSA